MDDRTTLVRETMRPMDESAANRGFDVPKVPSGGRPRLQDAFADTVLNAVADRKDVGSHPLLLLLLPCVASVRAMLALSSSIIVRAETC
jgi:hypothetical protein